MEVTLHATTVSRTLKLLKRRSELQKLIIYTFPVWIVYERLCFYAHEASGRECHLILMVASLSGCLHLELCSSFPFLWLSSKFPQVGLSFIGHLESIKRPLLVELMVTFRAHTINPAPSSSQAIRFKEFFTTICSGTQVNSLYLCI